MAKYKPTPTERGQIRAKAHRDADNRTYDGPFGLGILTGEKEAIQERDVYRPAYEERRAYNEAKKNK